MIHGSALKLRLCMVKWLQVLLPIAYYVKKLALFQLFPIYSFHDQNPNVIVCNCLNFMFSVFNL